MPERNPYTPPASAQDIPPKDPASLSELVQGWEKLRLLYNSILILPGLGILSIWLVRMHLPLGVGITLSILVAIAANIMFFLGPLTELYWRGLVRQGTPLGRGRMLIFSAGIVVSAGVFLIALLIAVFGG